MGYRDHEWLMSGSWLISGEPLPFSHAKCLTKSTPLDKLTTMVMELTAGEVTRNSNGKCENHHLARP